MVLTNLFCKFWPAEEALERGGNPWVNNKELIAIVEVELSYTTSELAASCSVSEIVEPNWED